MSSGTCQLDWCDFCEEGICVADEVSIEDAQKYACDEFCHNKEIQNLVLRKQHCDTEVEDV